MNSLKILTFLVGLSACVFMLSKVRVILFNLQDLLSF